MMEQGCLHLPGRATIKATEYRELIEDRLSALNLLAEKNRELVAADNRLEAQEEQIKELKERLQEVGGRLAEYDRFFFENPEEQAELGAWRGAKADLEEEPEGGAQ